MLADRLIAPAMAPWPAFWAGAPSPEWLRLRRAYESALLHLIHPLRSILLVEQNLPLALSVADRVHILSRGQIVHSSTPAERVASEEIKSRYLGVA